MIVEDEKLAAESSPVADADLTLADVNFGDVEKDVMNYMSGKTPEPKAPAVEDKPTPADPAPASDVKASEPEPSKPAPKMLTEADVDRMVNERLASANKPKPAEDPEPLLSEDRFADHDEWAKEMAAWTKREYSRSLEAHDSKRATEAQAQREHQADVDRRTKSWNERCEAAKTRHPDWDDVTTKLKATAITEEMIPALQFMADSPMGPDLWIHYGKRQDEFNKLVAMSPEDQKLELRFMERDLTRTPPPVPVKIVSDAPPPPRPMPGRTVTGDPLDDPDDYSSVERKVLGQFMKGTPD